MYRSGRKKKEIARLLEVDTKKTGKITRGDPCKPYERTLASVGVLNPWKEWVTKRAPEVNDNAQVLFRKHCRAGMALLDKTNCGQPICVSARDLAHWERMWRTRFRLCCPCEGSFATMVFPDKCSCWWRRSQYSGINKILTVFYFDRLGVFQFL